MPADTGTTGGVAAVIFDLDGVLIDSEWTWGEVREGFTNDNGGSWHEGAQREMMGMSSSEWSTYMRDELGVQLPPPVIAARVAEQVAELWAESVPLLPGAVDALRSLEGEWRLAIASSASRQLIDMVVIVAGLAGMFSVRVSSDEVERGKPAADVYLEAAGRLALDAGSCAAVEDSTNGIRSAHAAGMAVIAVPNHDFPPEPEALELADLTLDSLEELSPARVRALRAD